MVDNTKKVSCVFLIIHIYISLINFNLYQILTITLFIIAMKNNIEFWLSGLYCLHNHFYTGISRSFENI